MKSDSKVLYVVALNRAGLKDVSDHRLGFVGHCPHSLKRIATLPPIVNDFFSRTQSLREPKESAK